MKFLKKLIDKWISPFTAALLFILVGCSSVTSAPNADFIEHYIGTPLGNNPTIACTFEWIDEMVYELYGLTEEIKIVEKSVQ